MILDNLRVRVYNVLFGDAIFISFPERTSVGIENRHILIDVGNVLSGRGGDDAAFQPVIEDINRELDGRPLDLYVMTHEHLDHVQGLYFAKQNGLSQPAASYAWLTASAAEDYYSNHPRAKERRDRIQQSLVEINGFFGASRVGFSVLQAMLATNDARNTEACVNYLRMFARTTSYVHRGFGLAGTHPFTEATLQVLAPEEDTSVYYGNFQPLASGLARSTELGDDRPSFPPPPPGVDAGAFRDLVEARRRGYVDTLLAIDRAANNTSVVFTLEWRGWRLMFPGDAEIRSWKEIDKRSLLKPIHFLKVSHHGSANGLPPKSILDKMLPETPPDDRPRHAIVSTFPDAYPGVPDTSTLSTLGRRCDLQSVESQPLGGFVDVEFPG